MGDKKREQQMYEGEKIMLKEFGYETVLVRMVMALAAAFVVVLGVILLMGISFASCNPFIVVFGVTIVTFLFMVASAI